MSTTTARTSVLHAPDAPLRAALRLATVFALARLLFQFALTIYSSHLGYSYFRDEFYYIACGRHLAWGYVDHGPVVAVQAYLGEQLFGDSVFGIRVFSAAAGAMMIFLTGILTWALGGRRPAQGLAMLTAFVVPGLIGADGFLSMNSFEAPFWMTSLLALVQIVRERSERFWWMVFAFSSGIGLLNKPSMTFFLVCIGIGLLCVPQRRILFTRWACIGIVLTLLIALPNVVWQIQHHWPTLEFLRNGQKEGKNIVQGPLAFVNGQILQAHPITAFVWVAGLIALLRAKSITSMRWIGIGYLVFLPLMWKLHAKDYYLEPFYPILIAAGGVAWQHHFAARRSVLQDHTFAFPAAEVTLLVFTLPFLPLASPILAPMTWIHYVEVLHFRPKAQESGEQSVLPQFYADRFGWYDLVNKVDAAYRSLPPKERKEVCITGTNYGQAGSINFLGPRIDPDLPQAISLHNSYWMWGPQGCTWQTVISVSGASVADYQARYDRVEVFAQRNDPLAMPFERNTIYILHHRKPSMPVDWNDWKFYY